jgi:hypothetical protein
LQVEIRSQFNQKDQMVFARLNNRLDSIWNSQPLIVLRTPNTCPILFAATLLLRGTGNQLEDEESYVPNGDLRREPAIVQLVRYLRDLLADLAELLL